MSNRNSKIPESSHLGRYVDITYSVLGEKSDVADFSKVVHSELGRRVRLEQNNAILYSKIGDFCYTGENTTIRNAVLGKFNSISWNVSIGGNTHDMDKVTTHSFLVYPKWEMGGNSNWKSASEACILDNDIWVAAGVHILRGVHIGSGAVIGAGTIVTKDVPPYAVIAGTPGKLLRMRCADELIKPLLELKWWDFPEEIIRENFKLFHSKLTMDVVKRLMEVKEGLDFI